VLRLRAILQAGTFLEEHAALGEDGIDDLPYRERLDCATKLDETAFKMHSLGSNGENRRFFPLPTRVLYHPIHADSVSQQLRPSQ
jgi:hypothetical protein